MTKLTVKHLVELKACSLQVDLFQRLFGSSVEVTEELCLKHYSEFDWDWAAKHFLTDPALAAYERTTAPALAAAFGRLYGTF